MLIGPHGLDVFAQNAPVADFLSDLGKLLLMFFAGLETDLVLFRKARKKTMTFGLVTTTLPLLLGTAVGFIFGYHTLAAIVLGSLLASHTLLGLGIVRESGGLRLEPITITAGATVISDTLSLIVFAVCVPTYERGFSLSGLLIQLAEIAVFIPFILFGLSRVGTWALEKVQKDENACMIVMLIIVAVAGQLADLVNLPGIVGAFLAGLAVNAAVQQNPAKEKLEFLGNSFFVPIFFVVTGFLINPATFIHTLADNFPLAAAVVGALVLGKWLAAEIIGHAYGYSDAARKTMWSLTLPQVAATLAATLVAYKTFNAAHERLLDERTLNVVLVLMLTTSILGPVMTGHFTPRLVQEGTSPALSPSPKGHKPSRWTRFLPWRHSKG
jgi:Kef-type K+ transport system membrane component KefB